MQHIPWQQQAAEIWKIVHESWAISKETDRKIRETDRIIKEMSKETDRKFQETERLLKEKSLETAVQFKETDKKMRELQELFTGQWGKLVESLLSPGCVKIFQKQGIKITQSSSNVISQKQGKEMEIDVLLVNNTELVAIEVKTTARVKHINAILEEMREFKRFFPQYASYRAYGAIAALRFEEEADKYAKGKGIFVIKATGNDLIKLDNPKTFKPKSF